MAAQGDGSFRASAPFPQPPPFYKSFTPDNARVLEAARAEAGVDNPSDLDSSKLPLEVRHLIPPALPVDGSCNVFGAEADLSHSLPPLDTQLYSESADRQHEMLILTKSILLSFLELVALMSTDPSHFEQKAEDLNLLFKNLHHLINEYRPHMGREQLIQLMEDRIRTMREEVDGVKRMKDTVEDILKAVDSTDIGLSSNSFDEDEVSQKEIHALSEKERQQRAWRALNVIGT